jgi:hypothetical protein
VILERKSPAEKFFVGLFVSVFNNVETSSYPLYNFLKLQKNPKEKVIL